MGMRPSQFKKGGGIWNGEGTITGYEYTTEHPFATGTPRKGKKSDFNPLYAVLSARMDGADQDQQRVLLAGSSDDFEITEDGKNLTPVEEGFRLSADLGWGKFIASLVEGGLPETALPEDDADFSCAGIIGTRVRFKDQINEEATKKYGKRKAKNGKEYSLTDLMVDTVLELPQPAGKANGKSARPGGKATATATATRGKATAPAAPEVDGLAKDTLTEVLTEADDNSVPKQKLRMKVFAKFNAKHPQREQRDDVIKYLYDDANLAALVEEGVITYDPSDKQQIIALA